LLLTQMTVLFQCFPRLRTTTVIPHRSRQRLFFCYNRIGFIHYFTNELLICHQFIKFNFRPIITAFSNNNESLNRHLLFRKTDDIYVTAWPRPERPCRKLPSSWDVAVLIRRCCIPGPPGLTWRPGLRSWRGSNEEKSI